MEKRSVISSEEIIIRQADPKSADGIRLLSASHRLMRELFPSDACHILSVEALSAPEIRFYLAYSDGVAAGCVALSLQSDYGEVKSMFVDDSARGRGIGRILLDHIINEARSEGLGTLKLETGAPLQAALRLYHSAGFRQCGPFGGYRDHPASLFLECDLTSDSGANR